MAENATPSKIAATRAYGAEVVLHGTIWDEANEKAKELVRERGLTYVHPFDDEQLIAGQGTVGLEIVQDWPEVDVVVVPIGGGGLISGVVDGGEGGQPVRQGDRRRIVGRARDARQRRAGHVVTLDTVDCIIDGLRVKRVGEHNFEVVRRFVDEIVTLPDEQIFEAMIWMMSHASWSSKAPRRRRWPRCCTAWSRRRRIEGRLRPERRQRQPGSAQRPPLELARTVRSEVAAAATLYVLQLDTRMDRIVNSGASSRSSLR